MPSSVIAATRYYPATSVLRIVFLSGKIYDYKNVPARVYKAMLHAGSQGNFLNTKIKGRFDFVEVN